MANGAGEHAGRDVQAAHPGYGAHDRHAGHSVEMFRTRFWVSLGLTIPTLAFGHMIPSALGWHPPSFPGAALVPPRRVRPGGQGSSRGAVASTSSRTSIGTGLPR